MIQYMYMYIIVHPPLNIETKFLKYCHGKMFTSALEGIWRNEMKQSVVNCGLTGATCHQETSE